MYALAEYFITNLVVCVFSVTAIFRCTSESSGKLSNCLPGCLCELSKAVSSVHRVNLWNEVCVQRVHRFLIVLRISCVWEGGEDIVTKWILFVQAKIQNGCEEVHAQIVGEAYE